MLNVVNVFRGPNRPYLFDVSEITGIGWEGAEKLLEIMNNVLDHLGDLDMIPFWMSMMIGAGAAGGAIASAVATLIATKHPVFSTFLAAIGGIVGFGAATGFAAMWAFTLVTTGKDTIGVLFNVTQKMKERGDTTSPISGEEIDHKIFGVIPDPSFTVWVMPWYIYDYPTDSGRCHSPCP